MARGDITELWRAGAIKLAVSAQRKIEWANRTSNNNEYNYGNCLVIIATIIFHQVYCCWHCVIAAIMIIMLLDWSGKVVGMNDKEIHSRYQHYYHCHRIWY